MLTKTIFQLKFVLNNQTLEQIHVWIIKYEDIFIDIVRYVRINGWFELTPEMLIYAIYIKNSELIYASFRDHKETVELQLKQEVIWHQYQILKDKNNILINM